MPEAVCYLFIWPQLIQSLPPPPLPPWQNARRRIVEFASAVDPHSLLRPPLHDVLHELLPNMQPWRIVPEVGHLVSVLHLAAQMLWHFDQRSLDAIRTLLWVQGSLMVMRGLCFSSTLLPDSSQQCSTSMFLGSCHDLIFSGHVLLMALCILVGLLFFPATPWAHRALVWTLSLATTLLIAASRNHYTVDILMALFLTPLMLNFWITHPGALALGVLRPEDYPWAPPSRILGMPVVEEVPREEPKPAEQPGPSPPLSPLSSASAASSAGPPAPPAATTDSAEGEGVPPDAPQGSALGGQG